VRGSQCNHESTRINTNAGTDLTLNMDRVPRESVNFVSFNSAGFVSISVHSGLNLHFEVMARPGSH